MTSWSQLREHLDQRWRIVTSDLDWAGVLVAIGPVDVRVVVKPTGDPARAIVAANVCPLAKLPAEEALRYNGGSAHGMLMLEEGAYVLRQIVVIDRTDVDEVDGMIEAMAAEAARLRRALAGDRASLDAGCRLFAFMSD
jgi:hypothetical protein